MRWRLPRVIPSTLGSPRRNDFTLKAAHDKNLNVPVVYNTGLFMRCDNDEEMRECWKAAGMNKG
jgi:hypothetical protein